MKLDKIFEVQSVLDERKTPCDIPEILEQEYWSKSKKEYVRIGDMDITHFVRVYSKYTLSNVDLLDEINEIKNKVDKIEEKI
jgi:hypothetical protein|tara:strand:- start:229 stop:474 length:246 start_codon:yes stop_codon:yes gene_type:complete